MRQLNERGFTLVELMVAVAVLALLALAALPSYSSYLGNARLRESANKLVAAATLARNEAIKRNAPVRLELAAGELRVVQPVGASSLVLNSVALPASVQVAALNAEYDSAGMLAPFGTEYELSFEPSAGACSTELRCPRVRLEAGGAVTLCSEGSCQ